VDREEMGKAVAECIRRFAPLSQDELVSVLHASSFELARRVGQTPRTIADALFTSLPPDEVWRDEVLPIVTDFAAGGDAEAA
jgi:hypothetical protein